MAVRITSTETRSLSWTWRGDVVMLEVPEELEDGKREELVGGSDPLTEGPFCVSPESVVCGDFNEDVCEWSDRFSMSDSMTISGVLEMTALAVAIL